MNTVWKFGFEFPPRNKDTFVAQMPDGARPLRVGMQDGEVFIWALVNPTAPLVPRQFRVAGTGHPIDIPAERLRYVGTWTMMDDRLVWHLFEVNW